MTTQPLPVDKFLTGNTYRSAVVHADFFSKIFPSLSFYARLVAGPIRWLYVRAVTGRFDNAAWAYASIWTTELMESTGCAITIEGMDCITREASPCVFVANHMSTLETFMLPGILCPRRPITFVVKKSLTTMPVFGPIMRASSPIVVNRVNSREDFAAVLEGGLDRLKSGISVVVFPQSTRARFFDARRFNSIGIKLARRARVPVVPLALKTDAWGQGKNIKECGKIDPRLPVRYKFVQPIRIEGQGNAEHAAVCDYIATTLAQWRRQDTIPELTGKGHDV